MITGFLFFTGLFYIYFSMILHTKNVLSAVVFKYIPFISGLGTLLIALDRLGVVDLSVLP